MVWFFLFRRLAPGSVLGLFRFSSPEPTSPADSGLKPLCRFTRLETRNYCFRSRKNWLPLLAGMVTWYISSNGVMAAPAADQSPEVRLSLVSRT